MQIFAHVEVTVSPGTGNEEVSLFQLYPRPLKHQAIFSPQRRGATRRGRELERTSESDEDNSA